MEEMFSAFLTFVIIVLVFAFGIGAMLINYFRGNEEEDDD